VENRGKWEKGKKEERRRTRIIRNKRKEKHKENRETR
jgi:hypothetical protein